MSIFRTVVPPGGFDQWPRGLRDEMVADERNGCVGTVLLSETDRVRVWHLSIPPGARCRFHRHVLDYFWTCHSAGIARLYEQDGTVSEGRCQPGDTEHVDIAAGEHVVHAVENIGDTELSFTAVEYVQSANAPLTVPDSVRRTPRE